MRVEKWRLYLKKADLIREQAKLVLEVAEVVGETRMYAGKVWDYTTPSLRDFKLF